MMLGLAVPAMNGYAGAEDAGREVFEANRSGFEFTIPRAYILVNLSDFQASAPESA